MMLVTLAGCRTSPPPSPPAPTPIPAPSGNDVSYDWHGLLVAPLGSTLKDVPITLHEVILFRDEVHGAAAVDDADCYGADAPPQFLGRTPDTYLLCFKQDRLSRIQASVSVTAAQASGVFAAACAGWLKQASESDAGKTSECEGRDGETWFRGRLDEGTGGQEMSETELILSITLESASAG